MIAEHRPLSVCEDQCKIQDLCMHVVEMKGTELY